MKKYLAVLFTVVLFSSAVFAEVSSFDVKKMTKEYSNLVSPEVKLNKADHILFQQKFIDKNYSTKQYMFYENEMDEDYGQLKTPEEKTNKGYVEVSLTIPAGYKVKDYMYVTNGKILFLGSKFIPVEIKGKVARFELDYTINSEEEIFDFDYEDDIYTIIPQPITITIRYSPRYFVFAEDISGILKIMDDKGNITNFGFKPNYENIRHDFKFVREVK